MEQPLLPLFSHGVNGIGHESGNAQACQGRVLPWLQDVAGADVWALWQPGYRDCVVLDAQNRVHGVYNLTLHDLSLPENRAGLKALLLAAAAAP